MAFVETEAAPINPAPSTPEQTFQRQYSQVPPVLAAANVPAVSATSGNVAAGVQLDMTNGAKGTVQIFPNANVATSGSVALTFPSTPPTLFVGADQALGTVTQATANDVVTISWTGASMIGGRSRPYLIAFMWKNSQ